MRLGHGIGTTTPDVIYRGQHHEEDEGVCIYLDGLSDHLHGNPTTRAKDQEIRSWLRNNGYDVIEITAHDLHDENAMVRHFRKLAQYLNAGDLRSRVKEDRSWFHEAANAEAEQPAFVPSVVKPGEADKYVSCVPLLSLPQALQMLGVRNGAADSTHEWVALGGRRTLRAGMFVAQVQGGAMAPAIADGAWCLFAAPVEKPRRGKTVLVGLGEQRDPATGKAWTVRRYQSEKVTDESGRWRHYQVTLAAIDDGIPPIVLQTEDEDSVQVMAEVVEVLR